MNRYHTLDNMCDRGCINIFNKNNINIINNGKAILTGLRDLKDDLWDYSIQTE